MLIIENKIGISNCHPVSPVQRHTKERNANGILSMGLAYTKKTCVIHLPKRTSAPEAVPGSRAVRGNGAFLLLLHADAL